MSILRRAGEAAGRVLGAAARGQAVLVDVQTRDHRRAHCQVCPTRSSSTCTACGCNIAAKAALATERCPLGKW